MEYSKGLEELLENHTKRWNCLKEQQKSPIASVLDEVITEELIVAGLSELLIRVKEYDYDFITSHEEALNELIYDMNLLSNVFFDKELEKFICEVINPLIEFRAELDILFGGA